MQLWAVKNSSTVLPFEAIAKTDYFALTFIMF